MRALLRPLAQIVGLLLRDRPVQAQILRDHRAVGLVPDHDEPLLGPHHVQRLGAVGGQPVRRARLQQRVPQGAAATRRGRDLERELAGEGDAEGARRAARQPPLAHVEELEAFSTEINIRFKRLQDFPRVRPGDPDLRPLLGDVDDEDLEVEPFGLQPLLQPGVRPLRAARGGVAKELVLAEARHHAVVEQEPVLVAHQPVAAAPDLQASTTRRCRRGRETRPRPAP